MDGKKLLQESLQRETQDERTYKALSLLLAHSVSLDGANYLVASESDPTQTYHVSLEPAACDCQDARRRGPGCKHLRAAAMATAAISRAHSLAEEKGLPLAQLESRVAADLLAGVPTRLLADGLAVLLVGAQLAQEMDSLAAAEAAADVHDGESASAAPYRPERIDLVIRYRTTGAAIAPGTLDAGELVEVREEGFARAPKTADPLVAIRALQRLGYQPQGCRWLDPAGYLRRRISSFALATVTATASTTNHDQALPIQPVRGRAKLFKTS